MTRKVVICVNTSWNIYNFRLNLVRALKEAKYEVIIVAPYDEYSDILNKEFEYHNIYMNNSGTNPKEDLRTLIDFYKLYNKIKPDIVLNFTIKPNIYGNIICKWLNIKVINNISGLGTVFIKESFVTIIVKYLYKYALRQSEKVFFQNIEDRDLFIKNKMVNNNQCDLLQGSGVDTDKFKPINISLKTDTFKFLLIARMLWDKGIQEYVDAARILKKDYFNLEFQLLGSFDVVNKTTILKREVNEWVDENLINYLGVTDNVKVLIAKADCIVLPSYREGTPRTLLESASMAKPIIATDVPGCRNVVDDGINGFLCKVKDAKDLAEKMKKVIKLSEEQRFLLGQAGRKKMKLEFEEKLVIDKYLQVINNIE